MTPTRWRLSQRRPVRLISFRSRCTQGLEFGPLVPSTRGSLWHPNTAGYSAPTCLLITCAPARTCTHTLRCHCRKRPGIPRRWGPARRATGPLSAACRSESERLGIMTVQIDACPEPGGLGATIPPRPCREPGSAHRPEHCAGRRTRAGKLPVQTRLLPCFCTVVRLGPPKQAFRRVGGHLLWGQGTRSAPDRTALDREEH